MKNLMMIHTIAIFFLAALPISQKYAGAERLAMLSAMLSLLAYTLFWQYLRRSGRNFYEKLAAILGKIKAPIIAAFFLYEVSILVWENWMKTVSIYGIAVAFLLVCLYGAVENKNRMLPMAKLFGAAVIAWFVCIFIYGVIESIWLRSFSFSMLKPVLGHMDSVGKSIGIGIGIGVLFSPAEGWCAKNGIFWEEEGLSVKAIGIGWLFGCIFSGILYVFQLQSQALPALLICAYFGICQGIKLFSGKEVKEAAKKTGYYIAAVLIAGLTLLLAPDWKEWIREKNSQIEDRDYITAIGVEKGEEGYCITYGAADVKSVALGEADSSRIHVSNLTVLFGENWKTLANENLDRALDFSHVQAVIISENCRRYESEYQKLLQELQEQFSLRKNVFCFHTREEMAKIFAYNDAIPGGVGLYLGDLVRERRKVKTATLMEAMQKNSKLWQLKLEIFSQKVRLETSDSESGT